MPWFIVWQVKLVAGDGEEFIFRKDLLEKSSKLLKDLIEGVLLCLRPGCYARGCGFRSVSCKGLPVGGHLH